MGRKNNIFSKDRGRRKASYAFTEQSIYMLANVLREKLAEQVYHWGVSGKDTGSKW